MIEARALIFLPMYLQCSIPGCAVRLHPICGRRRGLHMVLEENKLRAYCASHSAGLTAAPDATATSSAVLRAIGGSAVPLQ